ncbi:transcriptional regulator [Spirochaetia bacterium]|nr:transcriptional regulator [Spirochaetia bacterium]
MELDADDKEKLSLVARALSVPVRVDMAGLLFHKPYSILDLAKELNIPASSAGVHVKILEEAGIITTTRKTIDGINVKICRLDTVLVHMILRTSTPNINEVSTLQIPIGSFTDCKTDGERCGLISETAFIGVEDDPRSFYLLEKINAQLIWLDKGFLEYKLPNILPNKKRCKQFSVSMELCSEAYGFDEAYRSDIHLSINGISCGFFRSNGDYGLRRGIYTPDFWQSGLTQYGKIANWTINDEGVFINMAKVSDTPISAFNLETNSHILMRLESKEDSEFCGGINLFGEKAGDYNQAIVMTVTH